MSIELEAGKIKRLDAELTPTVQEGIIQGYVVNKETGVRIPSAAIYLDGEFALYSWIGDTGGYRIANILYGTHLVTVEANDYETTDFYIVVDQPIKNINLEMPPLAPGPPGEWSDGVVVQSVTANPSVAYLGDTVNISVYIQYGTNNPSAYPVPTTIFGTVKVDGQELKKEFNITFRNPTLLFPYTASQLGEFTAVAQGKSAKFTVAESPTGTYYFPFGGVRIPKCTGFVIPGGSPGEDYTYPEKTQLGDPLIGYFPACQSYLGRECFTEGELRSGYPIKWNPLSPTNFDYYIRMGILPSGVGAIGIVVVPTSYSCPPYWDSKEELAQVIAHLLIESICGIKKGDPGKEGFYTFDGCDCINDIPGFPTNIDPVRGVTNWEKPIEWGMVGSGGLYAITLKCPYCTKVLQGPTRPHSHSQDYLPLARALLEHIENDHPAHPLTEQAWF